MLKPPLETFTCWICIQQEYRNNKLTQSQHESCLLQAPWNTLLYGNLTTRPIDLLQISGPHPFLNLPHSKKCENRKINILQKISDLVRVDTGFLFCYDFKVFNRIQNLCRIRLRFTITDGSILIGFGADQTLIFTRIINTSDKQICQTRYIFKRLLFYVYTFLYKKHVYKKSTRRTFKKYIILNISLRGFLFVNLRLRLT